MSGHGIIAPQADEVCELCGKVDECRPYGPNDENICFECAIAEAGSLEELVRRSQPVEEC